MIHNKAKCQDVFTMKARFTKYAQQQQVIKDNFAHFDVPYNGADNNDYVDGKGFSERDGSLKGATLKAASLKDNFQQGDSYEQYQYFYHPDHLGSSSFITNTEGEVVQHIEYVPYGEVFIEERNNVWNTPYLFNAKEFDEETGLYYYGARYYDARLSMWYGVDALAEKYPNMGGYVYCAGNPVKLVDPDGKKFISAEDEAVANSSIDACQERINAFMEELKANISDERRDELNSMIETLTNHINDINLIKEDDKYSFTYIKVSDNGDCGPNRKTGVIEIRYSDEEGALQHEETHAAQYIKGELTVEKRMRGIWNKRERFFCGNYTWEDELLPMEVEYSMLKSSVKNSRLDDYCVTNFISIRSKRVEKQIKMMY